MEPMPEDVPESRPFREPPTEELSVEMPHGRTMLFDPSTARLVVTLEGRLPPSIQFLYYIDVDFWFLLEDSLFRQVSHLAALQTCLPTGRILSRDQAIDWLLKHRAPIPEWLDISDRRIPGGVKTKDSPPVVDDQRAIERAPVESQPADEPLSQARQDVLVAMLELEAFTSDTRRPADDIAAKAGATDGKRAVAELRRLKLVETREGRGGGAWLTSLGRSRAERIKGAQ